MSKGNRKVEQSKYVAQLESAENEAEAKEEKEESAHTEASLLAMTNADLRDILDAYDGAPSSSGLKKSELVDAILTEQAK